MKSIFTRQKVIMFLATKNFGLSEIAKFYRSYILNFKEPHENWTKMNFYISFFCSVYHTYDVHIDGYGGGG